MELQTKIPLKKQSKNQIDYNSSILLVGSCFSENIANKLEYFKFQNLQNPFGILFHPKAIETFIKNVIDKKVYNEKDSFFHNEQWHCFDAHSKLSNPSKENLLKALNENIQTAHKQIQESTHIIITLGTAWGYRFLKSDTIVANCHKVPQKQFEKELQSVDDIYNSLNTIAKLIESINPKVSILFTVSPVRHLKDGFIENTQSKAHLISTIHKFLNQKSLIVNRNSFYFPSYEIMMDELRDYRFYKEDMIHPNETAVNYIWEKFKDVWISDASFKIMDAVDTIQKGLQHKPFNPNSEAHQKFLQNLNQKQKQLQKTFPHFKF
ncbi:GSCFA domain-containing protein [Algibacter sp. 2305UL17-15]|uniref:GSCFA domain-containing protein n=1 Tax=Algibacter sp. 2305UL17-15 TaxID=3231268 RepID=UPI003458F020